MGCPTGHPGWLGGGGGDGLGLGEGDGLGLGLGEGDGLGRGDGDGLGPNVGNGDGLGDGLSVGCGDGLGDGLGVGLDVGPTGMTRPPWGASDRMFDEFAAFARILRPARVGLTVWYVGLGRIDAGPPTFA